MKRNLSPRLRRTFRFRVGKPTPTTVIALPSWQGNIAWYLAILGRGTRRGGLGRPFGATGKVLSPRALTVLAFLFSAVPAWGREREFSWKSSVRYEYQTFEKDWEDGHAVTGAFERKFDWGSLIAEGFTVSRFGERDAGGALEGYVDLWKHAYGNLRVQGVVRPDVMPTTDVYAEVFQGFGRGWEASASYRNMNYSSSNVNMPGLSLGHYMGNWYLRSRGFLNPSHGAIGYGGAVSARYFLDESDGFVEAGGGLGRQVIPLGAGPRLDLRYNSYLLARAQKYVDRHFGGSILLSYNTAQRTPWGIGASLGALARW